MSRILLEADQEALLRIMVEASRNLTGTNRQEFLMNTTLEGVRLLHPGIPTGDTVIYRGDMDVLARSGLVLSRSTGKGYLALNVSPEGFAYYREAQMAAGDECDRIENHVRRFIDLPSCHAKHAEAFAKWRKAEELLWNDQDSQSVTSIGHLCREALQMFFDDIVKELDITDANPDKAHTIARAKAVLSRLRGKLGEAKSAFLDALLTYLGTVVDLVQRQEHGAQREKEDLVWDDARRVVFHTALVMYEFRICLDREHQRT